MYQLFVFCLPLLRKVQVLSVRYISGMGSLAGHVIPGSFFTLYGVFWVIISITTHLRHKPISDSQSKLSRSLKRDAAVSSYSEFKHSHNLSRKSWLPFSCCCGKFPLEPVLKIILSLMGIVVETFFDVVSNAEGHSHIAIKMYHIYDAEGNFMDLSKLHHITMYFAFMLSGIVDVLILFLRFPWFISPLFFSIAFWTEGTLFYFHAEGRDGFNVHIHFILTNVIFFCAVMSFLRLFYSTVLLINLGVGCGMVMQGLWFIQAGFLLFPPGTKVMHASDDHASTMLAVAYFTWHVVGVCVAVLVVWVVLSLVLKRSSKHVLLRKKMPALKNRSRLDSGEQRELIEKNGKGVEMETVSVDVQETAT